MKKSIFGMIRKFSTQLLKTDDMCIESSSSYLVATRFWDICFLKACEHRACCHYRTTQPSAFIPKCLAFKKIKVNIIRLENTRLTICTFCFNTHIREKLDQEVNINNVGDVADGYFAGCK